MEHIETEEQWKAVVEENLRVAKARQSAAQRKINNNMKAKIKSTRNSNFETNRKKVYEQTFGGQDTGSLTAVPGPEPGTTLTDARAVKAHVQGYFSKLFTRRQTGGKRPWIKAVPDRAPEGSGLHKRLTFSLYMSQIGRLPFNKAPGRQRERNVSFNFCTTRL